jgi:hypothetical protein
LPSERGVCLLATAIIREDAQRDSTPKGAKETRAWAACHAEVCLRLRCLATLLRCPNSIPQCSHSYGRAPVCVFMCSLRLLAVEYALPHLPPLPPPSPVSAGRLRSKQELLHGAGGAQARTRGSRCAPNARPHSWQACGRSPVCVRMCWMRCWRLANERVHRNHSTMPTTMPEPRLGGGGGGGGCGRRLKVQSLKSGPSKVLGSSAPSREGMSVALAKQRQRPAPGVVGPRGVQHNTAPSVRRY